MPMINRFFVSDANILDHGARRHDLPVGLLRLLARLLNRTPSKRPSCEEVLLLLDKILAESMSETESRGQLPVGALVTRQSDSPGRFIPRRASLLHPFVSAQLTDLTIRCGQELIDPKSSAFIFREGSMSTLQIIDPSVLAVDRRDRIKRQCLVSFFAVLRVQSIHLPSFGHCLIELTGFVIDSLIGVPVRQSSFSVVVSNLYNFNSNNHGLRPRRH